MSDIKINGSTYREEDVAFNWGVEFVKAMIDAHREKELLDHRDGSITMSKLASDVSDAIRQATYNGDANCVEIGKLKTEVADVKKKTESAYQMAESVGGIASTAEVSAHIAEQLANGAQTSADLAQKTADENAENLANSKLVYKVYQLKAGETFSIKPNMFCLVLPYGGKTLSIHKSDGSQVFSGNAGFTLCFAPEINTGEYANGHNHRVAFFYQPSNSLSVLASHHDLLEVGAYFKNNGDGNMYVYAVMREVDAV